MKKIIALLLALTMAFALCACGGETASPATSSAPAADNNAADNSVADSNEPEAAVWPSTETVTVYIPADVGAPLDLAARVAIDYLSEVTGATFIPENDATGGGARIAEKLKSSAPDGSAISFCGAGQIVSYYNGTWESNIADPESFTVIGPMIGQSQPSGAIICTQVDAPYDTLEEFVQYVKDNPGIVTVAIVTGTPHEVRLKLLLDYFGIYDQVRFVSTNNNDAITGILGGSVNIACLTETVGGQHVLEGTMKGLVNVNYERNYPDDELKPAHDSIPYLYEIIGEEEAIPLCCAWGMIIAGPAGMSDELCNAINDTFAGIADSEEYMERIHGLGGTNTYEYMTVEETRAAIALADEQTAGAFAK